MLTFQSLKEGEDRLCGLLVLRYWKCGNAIKHFVFYCFFVKALNRASRLSLGRCQTGNKLIPKTDLPQGGACCFLRSIDNEKVVGIHGYAALKEFHALHRAPLLWHEIEHAMSNRRIHVGANTIVESPRHALVVDHGLAVMEGNLVTVFPPGPPEGIFEGPGRERPGFIVPACGILPTLATEGVFPSIVQEKNNRTMSRLCGLGGGDPNNIVTASRD